MWDNIDKKPNYKERVPLIPNVAWIFCYPKIGKLVSLPDDNAKDRPPYLQALINYVPPGTVYEKRSSCGDAVSCIIVTAENNNQCEERIKLSYEWFERNSVWEK